MNTTLSIDIAAILTAIMWPLAVLIVLLAYRKKFPAFIQALASRVTKLGVAGFEMELAAAKPYQLESDKTAGVSEFWAKASSTEVNDSYAMTFFNQLTEGGPSDYALINLSNGKSWLTSRLFIISILYAQIKGVKVFIFVETEGGARKRYIGWAGVDKIRWALSRKYEWLEIAYQDAYKQMLMNGPLIVSEYGKLSDRYNPDNSFASINLLKAFVTV
jgi:hypothetical protein